MINILANILTIFAPYPFTEEPVDYVSVYTEELFNSENTRRIYYYTSGRDKLKQLPLFSIMNLRRDNKYILM